MRGPGNAIAKSAGDLSLRLLDGFELSAGGVPCSLPANAQRVLAYLALRGRTQARVTLAGRLWEEVPQTCALASLRTALWRIRQAHAGIVASTHSTITLNRAVTVDLEAAIAQARWLGGGAEGLDGFDWQAGLLGCELLPEWDEDWVTLERERIRQVQLHSLDELCRQLRLLGRYADAVDIGHQAVSAEPLRESAQMALIRAHLAEGNLVEARRQYESYAELLASELGVPPSDELRSLLPRPCATRRRRPAWGHGVLPPSGGLALGAKLLVLAVRLTAAQMRA
jgi:DNA-binding SARP family transcriptional activator